jgi:glycosyltransferase involved in cell wall biosynthesis
VTPSCNLRILLLAHNVEGIGTHIRFEQMAIQLARLGHSVTLVAGSGRRTGKAVCSSSGTLTKILVPEICGRRISNGGLGLWEALYRIRFVLRNEFDIVHVSEHRPAASVPGLVARKFRSARFVSDWADLWGRGGIVENRNRLLRVILRFPESSLENRIHGSADGVTAISSFLRDRAVQIGVSPDKVLLIHNGADTEEIRPVRREEARRRLGLPDDGRILVYAGMAPIDMDLVWESFRLADSQARGKLYLLVLGKRWHLPEKMHSARARIFQPGMVKREEYPLYLSAGDIMLLPMRKKTINLARWPGKFGDYLAAGRPIVSNPTGDVGKIIEDGPVGLLAGETPGEFCKAILSLASDPAACEIMGARARMAAEEKFGWEKTIRPLPDFYSRVTGPSIPGEPK